MEVVDSVDWFSTVPVPEVLAGVVSDGVGALRIGLPQAFPALATFGVSVVNPKRFNDFASLILPGGGGALGGMLAPSRARSFATPRH